LRWDVSKPNPRYRTREFQYRKIGLASKAESRKAFPSVSYSRPGILRMQQSSGFRKRIVPLAQLGVRRPNPTGSLFCVLHIPHPDLSLEAFVEALAAERRLDLRGYKHATLERRFKKRMQQIGIHNLRDYLKHMQENPPEKNALLDTVLINVTEFFRDPQAWDVVGDSVLPHLLRHKRPGESFRAWVAGCATGEEVYSLAMLVAEYLGERLPELDVRIYATDVDDSALDIARRGEYPPERLRRLPPHLRGRYFRQPKHVRVNAEIRRMVIFGRGDLVNDAPIPHVELIVCRNVLIYFDAPTQRRILARFHYALEDGGILFLGKAESRLTDSTLFTPVHSRWRIFRRSSTGVPLTLGLRVDEATEMDANTPQNKRLHLMQIYQDAILSALGSGVMVLDENDLVVIENEVMSELWDLPPRQLAGRKLQETSFAGRCEGLAPKLAESKQATGPVQFVCEVKQDSASRMVQVELRPIAGDGGQRHGTLIHAEDVSHREELKRTINQLESTGEALQSANEELETTNEELQSTNEELETTNEELQSTNEELETTNEELQSLNEELENMNEELEYRGRELDVLNSRYMETIEQMPWPMMTIDREGKVQFWNSAAARLFGLQGKSVVGLDLDQLPVALNVRKVLSRHYRAAFDRNQQISVRGIATRSSEFGQKMDITITPLAYNGTPRGAIIMFGVAEAGVPLKKSASGRDGASGSARNGGFRKAALKKPQKTAKKRSSTKRP
jgi:two-component system, chemotaxis family, CheB/CheR fusion protein